MPFISDSSYPDFTRERTPSGAGDWRGLDDDWSPWEYQEERAAEFIEARHQFDDLLDTLSRKWLTASRAFSVGAYYVGPTGVPVPKDTDGALVRRYVAELSEDLEMVTLAAKRERDPGHEFAIAIQQNLPAPLPRRRWHRDEEGEKYSTLDATVAHVSHWSIYDIYGAPYGKAIVIKFVAHQYSSTRDGALVIVAKGV